MELIKQMASKNIIAFEERSNPTRNVFLTNVKVFKRRKIVSADVHLLNDTGNREEIYRGCEYTYEVMGL